MGWLAPCVLAACSAEVPPPTTTEPAEPVCDHADCANLQSPEIVSIEPEACADLQCAAPIESAIHVRFSEPIDPLSVAGGQVTCTGTLVMWQAGVDPAMGPCVEGAVAVDGRELSLTPAAPLLPGTTYEVYVSEQLRDLSGATMPAPYRWQFTTQAPPQCGNAQVTAGEACDDGNVVDGDYCAANCAVVTGACGDAVLQPNLEACDDGNTDSADGCSARCALELHEPLALPSLGASCGLRRDGTLRCWGGPLDAAPEGFYSELAVGDDFACALGDSPDGGAERPLSCWGSIDMALGVDFQSMVGGGDQLCGLAAGGAVRCMGMGAAPALQLSGQGYTRLALGPDFLCALDANGTPRCAGGFDSTPLSNERGWIALAAGDGFVCGLDATGEARCFGGGEGARGLQSPPSGPFVALAAGGMTLCAQQASGVLVCWHASGGAGNSPGTRAMASYALGPEHGCGITLEGAALCWAEEKSAATEVPEDFP